MRGKSKTTDALRVRAIAGLHTVVLAWDFRRRITVGTGALPGDLSDLLGFSIERAELKPDGTVAERYVLRGIKRFKDKDEGLAPGTPVPLNEHPVQSFQWSDYTAKPGTRYVYTIVPMTGTPKNLVPRTAAATSVEVTTEPEEGPVEDGVRHDIYFNRGVIGSQAYARKFENKVPDRDNPEAPEMKWLSRGLFEGLVAFIGRAQDQRYSLRAAFYEFRYLPVAFAFRRAVEAGADVKIVYDAESSYKAENIATLETADLFHSDIQRPRTVSEGIRHNKFIVLLEDGAPIAVWTGSTNVSAGGIFGHSNVGHAVWNPAVAKTYLDYWERLEQNLTPTKLVTPNRAATPTPAGKPPKGVTPLFSARDKKPSLETLD